MEELAVQAKGVSKVYSLTFQRFAAQMARYLRAASGNERGIAGMLRRRGKVQALRNVSFSISKGQVVGIIGVNGSGKSTLLRILAGMAKPSSGVVRINGKVTSILNINTGLAPDLTGRECVSYMGNIYGMTTAEIARKEEDILQFADIGRFVDYPVRTYSSGMKARLAFSIVTAVDPDILLIDEALSVGDAGFALKCRQRMHEMRSKGATVLIVSHSMESIRELCQRVLWLHQGELRMDGEPGHVIESYRVLRQDLTREELARKFGNRTAGIQHSNDVFLDALHCVNEHGDDQLVFRVGESFALQATCRTMAAVSDVCAQLDLTRNDGLLVLSATQKSLTLPVGKSVISINFGEMRLGRFPYEARFALRNKDGQLLVEKWMVFAVEDDSHAYNPGYYQPVVWNASSASAEAGASLPGN